MMSRDEAMALAKNVPYHMDTWPASEEVPERPSEFAVGTISAAVVSRGHLLVLVHRIYDAT